MYFGIVLVVIMKGQINVSKCDFEWDLLEGHRLAWVREGIDFMCN